jgi:hypothetical protein
MDAIGLLLSATLVVTVFVAFELVVRFVCDAIDDVRYSVAPTVLGGLRAWGDERNEASVPDRKTTGGDDQPPPPDPRPDVTARRMADGGLVVPVTRVTPDRSGCAAA